MKKLIIIVILFCSNMLYGQFNSSPASLFSDVKAREIDDAVTILITEDTKATNSAGTSLDRNDALTTKLGVGASSSGGLGVSAAGSIDVNSGSDFHSNSSNTRKESFQTRLSARVVDVEQNGNLILRGRRSMTINGEEQTVTIQGTVRPVDISPNNTIYSYLIMDMKLIIEGDGNLTEVQNPGLITKFIRFIF